MPRARQGRLQNVEVIALIVVTLAVFFHEQSLSPYRRGLFDDRFGAIPSVMWDAWHTFREVGFREDLALAALPLLTANYLHADLGHIAGNMLFLWIFGNVVSQTVGRPLFYVVYVVAGVVAVLVHVHANPDSDAPMIGASGAIAGLEGAYFALVFLWEVPHANVWPASGPVPAARLALLAVANFVMDTGAFVGHTRDHVAYGAHVGGFLGGAMVAVVIASLSRPEWRGGGD
jgi:membrane associated rhomboid family serine protease